MPKVWISVAGLMAKGSSDIVATVQHSSPVRVTGIFRRRYTCRAPGLSSGHPHPLGCHNPLGTTHPRARSVDYSGVGGTVMNHQRTIYYGTAVIAAAGIAVSAAACGASSPSNASPSSSVRYYQEGYRYAQANISPPEHQILGHAGYAKWCATATAATNDLNNAPGGPSSKAAKHWVKGCDSFAASVGLSANASHAPAPPAATPPPATQPPPPAATTPPAMQPPPPAPAPSSPGKPASTGTDRIQSQSTGSAGVAGQGANGGQFGGGTQNPCNNPANSFLGDCGGVPKGPGGP